MESPDNVGGGLLVQKFGFAHAWYLQTKFLLVKNMSRHDVWAVSARRRLVSEPVGGLLNRSEILGSKFSFQAKFGELTLLMVKDTWFLSTSSKETKNLGERGKSSPS